MTCEMCGEEIEESVCPFCLTEQTFSEPVSRKKAVMNKVNIKDDLPTSDTALSRLQNEMSSARASGLKAIKVVHGYGSSGRGGVIKNKVHRFLEGNDSISGWIPGEEFSAEFSDTLSLLKRFPFLENDKDFRRRNLGISIIIF
jgi:hypothetical protein